MKGINQLVSLRESGKRPNTVWINFDGEYRRAKYQQDYLHLELHDAPTRDFRPFVGLDVILHSEHWTPRVGQVFEGLKPYAKTVSVLVNDFGADIGWWWSKEKGQVPYGN